MTTGIFKTAFIVDGVNLLARLFVSNDCERLLASDFHLKTQAVYDFDKMRCTYDKETFYTYWAVQLDDLFLPKFLDGRDYFTYRFVHKGNWYIEYGLLMRHLRNKSVAGYISDDRRVYGIRNVEFEEGCIIARTVCIDDDAKNFKIYIRHPRISYPGSSLANECYNNI